LHGGAAAGELLYDSSVTWHGVISFT